jgi:hypothetical protein
MGTLIRASAALVLSTMLGCSSSSDAGAPDASADARPSDGTDATILDASADASPDSTVNADDGGASDASDASADARDGSSCPPNVACGCVCPAGDAGGDCVCENFSMPYCPPAFRDIACQLDGGCMGCSMGAGYECGCYNPDGSTGLFCLGTEQGCTGGTPF